MADPRPAHRLAPLMSAVGSAGEGGVHGGVVEGEWTSVAAASFVVGGAAGVDGAGVEIGFVGTGGGAGHGVEGAAGAVVVVVGVGVCEAAGWVPDDEEEGEGAGADKGIVGWVGWLVMAGARMASGCEGFWMEYAVGCW